MIVIFIKIFIIPAFFYGIANWLMWQGMKKGSQLPSNKNFADNGGKISRVIKFIYFIVIAKFSYENRWYYIFSFFPVWYIGGWIGTFIERILYGEKVMNMAMDIINKSAEDIDIARKNLADSIPNWWVLLMPKNWSGKIEESLRNMIK